MTVAALLTRRPYTIKIFILRLSLWLWSLELLRHHNFILLRLFLVNSVKSNSQIFGSMANMVELIIDKFYLFSQLSSTRRRSEFDCFYKSIVVFKLLMKLMGRLNFENIIPESNNICYGLHFKFLSDFQKRSHFPFLVLFGVLIFKFWSSWYNFNILL